MQMKPRLSVICDLSSTLATFRSLRAARTACGQAQLHDASTAHTHPFPPQQHNRLGAKQAGSSSGQSGAHPCTMPAECRYAMPAHQHCLRHALCCSALQRLRSGRRTCRQLKRRRQAALQSAEDVPEATSLRHLSTEMTSREPSSRRRKRPFLMASDRLPLSAYSWTSHVSSSALSLARLPQHVASQ